MQLANALLCLLPKSYPRRIDIVKALEALRAHEHEQLKFADLLTNGGLQ